MCMRMNKVDDNKVWTSPYVYISRYDIGIWNHEIPASKMYLRLNELQKLMMESNSKIPILGL